MPSWVGSAGLDLRAKCLCHPGGKNTAYSNLYVCVCAVFAQKSGCPGEPSRCLHGLPGFLPGFCASQPRLLQRLLGLPVLPGHRQLPVFFTEGEKRCTKIAVEVRGGCLKTLVSSL